MTILEIIAAAETTSNNWIQRLTSGTMQAILTFGDRKIAASVAMSLREAGALVNVQTSAYGEEIMVVTWYD